MPLNVELMSLIWMNQVLSPVDYLNKPQKGDQNARTSWVLPVIHLLPRFYRFYATFFSLTETGGWMRKVMKSLAWFLCTDTRRKGSLPLPHKEL